jgi:hypothetical protein
MELAIQYIKENPVSYYITNCPVYTISCTIPVDNPTQCKQITCTKHITVYWDLSYGPVYICKTNIDNESSKYEYKKLYGVGRTCTADTEYPESEFNRPKQVKECELKFVSINDVPTYIMIHSIALGYDCMHDTYSDDYILWDINGNILLNISRELCYNSTTNWYFTHDNKWIIIWDYTNFRPIIINVDELITNQKKINYEYSHRIDRMDFVYTVSPFSVMGMYYNDNILHVALTNHHLETNRTAELTDYKCIGVIYEFDEDVMDSPPLTYCQSIDIDLTTRKICKTKYYD